MLYRLPGMLCSVPCPPSCSWHPSVGNADSETAVSCCRADVETKDDQLNRLQNQIQIQGDELRLIRGTSGDSSPHAQVCSPCMAGCWCYQPQQLRHSAMRSWHRKGDSLPLLTGADRLQAEGDTGRLQQLVLRQHEELQQLRDLMRETQRPRSARSVPPPSLADPWSTPLRHRLSPLLPVHHDLFCL